MATELTKLQRFLDTKDVAKKVEKDPKLRNVRREEHLILEYQVEDILKLVTDGITKEEFLKSFKAVVDIVLRIEKRNTQAVEKLQKTFEEETTRFVEANSGIKVERMKIESIKGLEKDFGVATKQLRESSTNELKVLRNEITKALGKAQKEQFNTMNFLRDKVRDLKDGHTPTEEELLTLVKPLIPIVEMPELKIPQEIFDGIIALKEENEEQQKEIEALKKRPLGRLGGGGTTDIGITASLGRIVKTETPTGDINGSNTAYTITSAVNAVLSFDINGMAIHSDEYSISGKTITFTSALPTSLSGKSFEIIYI